MTRYVKIILITTLLIANAACQTPPHTPQSPTTAAQMTPGTDTRAQVYRFNANPTSAIMLSFVADSANVPFTAEVRAGSGAVVAVLGGSTLITASLTLPPGTDVYEVTVSAPANPKNGRVSLALNTPENTQQTAQYRTAAFTTVAYSQSPAAACSASTTNPSGIPLRPQPDARAAASYMLPPNTRVKADLRTSEGWYRLNLNGVLGWVLGDSVTLSGVCSGLPLENPAAQAVGGAVIPGVVAPFDVDSYYFEVDLDSGGRFSEAISYPNGDNTDRVLMTVKNSAGGVYARVYAVTLFCRGNGADSVRWGTPEDLTLGCGETREMRLNTDFNTQHFIITIPGASGQSYVDYVLQAVPVAPVDAPVYALGLDRDAGGQLSEVISTSGDREDLIQLSVPNLTTDAANSYREYHLTLLCSGAGIAQVRWGAPQNPALTCGSTAAVTFSASANLQNLRVMFPENSAPGYVTYTLRAVAAAPYDADDFWLGIDRDSGGRFNETLSYPEGDRGDIIQLIVSNLTGSAPNDRREIDVVLYCAGVGADHVRWGISGQANLLCGSALRLSFTHNTNRQTLLVHVPVGSGQSYVNYTLVALPAK